MKRESGRPGGVESWRCSDYIGLAGGWKKYSRSLRHLTERDV